VAELRQNLAWMLHDIPDRLWVAVRAEAPEGLTSFFQDRAGLDGLRLKIK
jgi:hypothetical protein